MVVFADDVHGPRIEPVALKVDGIDPGHAVSADEKRYLFLNPVGLVPLADDGLSATGPTRKVYGWRRRCSHTARARSPHPGSGQRLVGGSSCACATTATSSQVWHSPDGRTYSKHWMQWDVAGYHHNVAGRFASLRPALLAAGAGKVRFRNFRYRVGP